MNDYNEKKTYRQLLFLFIVSFELQPREEKRLAVCDENSNLYGDEKLLIDLYGHFSFLTRERVVE